MKKREKRSLYMGIILIALFLLWTILIKIVDVQMIGETGQKIGFATLNGWFHKITGVHFGLYNLTDWLGLVPVFVCLLFGVIGLKQLIQRRKLLSVDLDILFLGAYYLLVILCYIIFEMYPINYRPVLIEGRMEASYPSSTTLLVLSVMPTLVGQVERRLLNKTVKKVIKVFSIGFIVGMVVGRLISGVHWITDIVGAILLSMGLFYLYQAAVSNCCKKMMICEGE